MINELMGGEVEFGKCDICGENAKLARTYFVYPIKCECHGNNHFEMIKHCENCTPVLPKQIRPEFKGMDGKIRKALIMNIFPSEISGEFLIDDTDYLKYRRIKKWFDELKPFDGDIEKIPSIPRIDDKNLYKDIIVRNLIRCGAIPKSELKIGHKYLGTCRNANEATWNGKHFIYQRTKFKSTYDESINHFEDDNGYDLFVPIKLKDNL